MNLGPESETVEFKKSTGELKEAAVSICAILNKRKEGTLYFGVENNGDIVGQDIGAKTARDVSHRIYEKIRPIPNISVDVLWDGERRYIRVAFDGKEVPYSSDGRYYMRVSDEDREMTQEQLRDLFYDIGDNSEWENGLTEHTIDDVDNELLVQCHKAGTESGRIKGRYDKENMLSKLRLLVGGNLTNAGNCLLSVHGPVTLRMGLFATDEMVTFLDIKRFQGNMIECIDEAMIFIKKSIRWRVEIPGLRRVEVPEVPEEAIREIVINSFVHARYKNASATPHRISISPGRIEVFNPGRLPSGIVPEEYLGGRHDSDLKNPAIAEFMFRSAVIEAFGTGFRKVLSLCNEKDIRYDYHNDPFGFTFIFFRDPLFTAETVPIPQGSEMEVYRLLQKDDKLTADVIAQLIGRDVRTVFRKIDVLKQKGLIKRDGSTRKGHWAILPAPFNIDTVDRKRRKNSEEDKEQ
ncbi:MAG: putative DNA binding domain-containing protein [Methanomassiliicoccaceae archaeon]|nr:putative DNA binding domain-containing protein [Methanomassiliicoccaceae archaeon]